MSATPVYSVVFLTHASTAYATGARQRWQGRARGSRPGHGLVPLAPRPRNHARPLDEMHASDPPQSPAVERRAPWPSSAIRAPDPGCPSAHPIAPPPLGGQPLHTESRRLRRSSREENGATTGRRTGSTPEFGAPPQIKPERTTLHGTASGGTRPQLVTAPPSFLPQHPW